MLPTLGGTEVCVFLQVCRIQFMEDRSAGLVLFVCTEAPHGALDTEAEQSLLLFMVLFFLASGSLLEQLDLWWGWETA